MSHRVAVLIRRSDSLLLIRRVKEGQGYYVIPGGSVEQGETIAAAAVREVREELSLTIDYETVLWRQMNEGKMETYVKAANVRGEVALGGPEAERQSAENQYHPEWVPLAKLGEVNLLPESVKEKILGQVEQGRL